MRKKSDQCFKWNFSDYKANTEADHQEGKVTLWAEGEVNLDKVKERIVDLGFEVEEG